MRIPLRSIMITASFALASGIAHADGDGGDNSMSPFYGDSWAALQAHQSNFATPALQVLDDRDAANAALHDARDRMHRTVSRWRDNASRVIHRSDNAPAS